MPAMNVDIVLVIDSSDSMKPCIDKLRQHLRELIKPMQGRVGKVRFGLVALSAAKSHESTIYSVETMAGGSSSVDILYEQGRNQYEFFSEDADMVIQKLDQIDVSANEDNLLALDIALDHPFGPVSTTKRVVALFSDERLENGVSGGDSCKHIPALIQKLHQRRVKLFCAIPYSEAAQSLSQANGSEIEDVGGATGLATVDFRALLTQMGKSISMSSLQGALEEKYQRALFGQDEWTDSSGSWDSQDDQQQQ